MPDWKNATLRYCLVSLATFFTSLIITNYLSSTYSSESIAEIAATWIAGIIPVILPLTGVGIVRVYPGTGGKVGGSPLWRPKETVLVAIIILTVVSIIFWQTVQTFLAAILSNSSEAALFAAEISLPAFFLLLAILIYGNLKFDEKTWEALAYTFILALGPIGAALI